jgi:spermidine synthase
MRSARRWVLAAAVISGASSLCFELLWVRQATLFIGHSTAAVSAIIAAFMGGLGLGALLSSRWADALPHPLRAYAALELAAAALSIAVTFLLPHGLLPLVPLPAIAMGATLPLLVSAARSDARPGEGFGWVYAANTLGAAAGCLLSGFVLIGWLGVTSTGLLAASGNLAAALLGWLTARERPAPAAIHPAPPRAPARILALAAAGGFAALGLEVLWFRALASALDSTSYAFSLLLSVYLASIVAGSWLYARRPSPRPPLARFAEVQALFALAALLSLLLLGQLRALEHLFTSAPPYLAMALRAAAVLLVPCALSGLALPLLVQAAGDSRGEGEGEGRAAGSVYAANTAGGIAGSLLVGLWLIPAAGSQLAFALTCGAAALSALLAGWRQGPVVRAGAAGVLAVVVAVAVLPRDYLLQGLTRFSDSRVVAVREGVDGTLAVLEYDRESVCRSGLYACGEGCPDFHHRQLLFGPISYASTVLPAKRYMRALAHLPMLAHPDPRSALLICFGTGTTAGAFAAHRPLERLTLVDLNPDVFALGSHFESANGGVLHDPRVQPVVSDARRFLATSPDLFDVISFEPPPPRSAGAVNLYTRDFYQLVKRRLREGGVVAQWIPLGQQSDALSRALIRAVTDEFREVTLWLPARLDAVLLASDTPQVTSPAGWAARWPEGEGRAALEEIGLDGPHALGATFVAGTEALRAYVAGAPDLTDDRPVVEYFLSADPRPFDGEAFEALAAAQPQADPALRHLLRAHLLGRRGEYDQARGEVDQASRRLQGERRGPDPYTEFLRELEYRCLTPTRR